MIQQTNNAIATDAAQNLYEQSLRQSAAALKHMINLANQPDVSQRDKTVLLVTNALLMMSNMWTNSLPDGLAMISKSIRLIQHWDFCGHELVSGLVPNALLLLFFVKIERTVEESLLVSSKPTWGWGKTLSSLQKQPITTSVYACLELEIIWSGVQAILQNLPF